MKNNRFDFWEKMTKRNTFKFFKIHYTSELIRKVAKTFLLPVWEKPAILEKLRFVFLQMIGF